MLGVSGKDANSLRSSRSRNHFIAAVGHGIHFSAVLQYCFSKLAIGFKKLFLTCAPTSQVTLLYGQLEVLRTLDAVAPAKSTHCAPGRYVLSIFLTHPWRLNNYGQVCNTRLLVSEAVTWKVKNLY